VGQSDVGRSVAAGQLHIAADVAVVYIATADARHLQVATGLVDGERTGGNGLGPDRAGNALQGDVAGAHAAEAHTAIALPGAGSTRAHGLDHQFPGLPQLDVARTHGHHHRAADGAGLDVARADAEAETGGLLDVRITRAQGQ